MPIPPRHVIRSVNFLPDGSMGIEFVGELDVKANGMQLDQVLYIPANSEYDDEIDAVRGAAIAALLDALQDFPELEAMSDEPTGEDDDDT